jgi:surface protein
MRYIFADCSSLETLDLSNFKTSKLNNINNMFSNCTSLKDLNLSNFNISSDIDNRCIFYNCSSLNLIEVSDDTLINLIKKSFVVENFMGQTYKFTVKKQRSNISCGCEIF